MQPPACSSNEKLILGTSENFCQWFRKYIFLDKRAKKLTSRAQLAWSSDGSAVERERMFSNSILCSNRGWELPLNLFQHVFQFYSNKKKCAPEALKAKKEASRTQLASNTGMTKKAFLDNVLPVQSGQWVPSWCTVRSTGILFFCQSNRIFVLDHYEYRKSIFCSFYSSTPQRYTIFVVIWPIKR